MTGNSIFIKKEEAESGARADMPQSWFKSPADRRFVRKYISGDPTQYEEGSAGDGVATVVPIATRTGGIPNESNKYGRIVVGHVFGASEVPGEHTDVSILEKNIQECQREEINRQRRRQARKSNPKATPKLVPDTADVPPQFDAVEQRLKEAAVHDENIEDIVEAVQEQVIMRELPEDEREKVQREIEQGIENERHLAELLAREDMLDEKQASERLANSFVRVPANEAAPPPPSPLTAASTPLPVPAPQVVTQMPIPQQVTVSPGILKQALDRTETISVELKGWFGKSRNKYLAVEKYESQLILVYDKEADVYSPPSGEEKFRVRVEDQEDYTVIAVGIEFELKKLGLGFQVFLVC